MIAKDDTGTTKQLSLGKNVIATDPEQPQQKSNLWLDSKQRDTSHRERKDPNHTNFITTEKHQGGGRDPRGESPPQSAVL